MAAAATCSGDALSAADLTCFLPFAPVVMPPNYGTAPLLPLADLPRGGWRRSSERFRATAAGRLALRLYAEAADGKGGGNRSGCLKIGVQPTSALWGL